MDRIQRIVEHKVERVTPFFTASLQTVSCTIANNRHWAADLIMILAFLSSSDGLEMNWRLTANKLVSGEAFEINGWNRLKAAFFVAT